MKLPKPCSPFHSNHTCPLLSTVDPLTSPNFSPPAMDWPVPKSSKPNDNQSKGMVNGIEIANSGIRTQLNIK
jgi:hypothetical protein